MLKAGMRSKIRRKYRLTTDSKHHFTVSPNLLEQNSTTPTWDKVWASAINYLATRSDWVY